MSVNVRAGNATLPRPPPPLPHPHPPLQRALCISYMHHFPISGAFTTWTLTRGAGEVDWGVGRHSPSTSTSTSISGPAENRKPLRSVRFVGIKRRINGPTCSPPTQQPPCPPIDPHFFCSLFSSVPIKKKKNSFLQIFQRIFYCTAHPHIHSRAARPLIGPLHPVIEIFYVHFCFWFFFSTFICFWIYAYFFTAPRVTNNESAENDRSFI